MISAAIETEVFRTLDKSENHPDKNINPYNLEDLKHRVIVARVGGEVSSFDDLCVCGDGSCSLSTGKR
jgi:3-phenylpropionate/trans-cinnamate dioxygenase ferredoxin component